ncbi:MAG: RdgB/HAM1 family non-canonical purine NTP pyrophosphatase [Pseudomonadota bacterium]|nr:RdgB/HAM1 family non-canonical purine NTP pyrophosphatase [Pseudomonadota bacterium]
MIKKIVLATHNAHKLEEVRAILTPLGIEVIGGDEAGLKEIAETGTTFEENSRLKACAAYEQLKLPVLADDSGLCITALNGRPGLYSARFAAEHGGFPAVFDTVWKELKPFSDWSAYFICTMVLKTGPHVDDEHLFMGKMLGHIAPRASGTHLFGYDPIFIPDGYTDTCGVLEPEIKNQISHRARALAKLVEFLKNRSTFPVSEGE